MLNALTRVPRLLMEVDLKPVQGDRFQPTGFADLGAAIYERPDGTRMLLVESAQSVANRLEKTCLDGDGPRIAKELSGLPYVVAKLQGESTAETSSLVEAHRINSPYIISDEGFQQGFLQSSGYAKGAPLDWKKIGNAIFRSDPNSLLHGVFMANLLDGRIKMARALSGFVEAEEIREVASGGVKNNHLDPSGKIQAKNYAKDVYGNVPYHRTEFVAGKIVAYFNFDLALLRGYGLPTVAWELLVALGLYKVRSFLAEGLRLRTACDFAVIGDARVTDPSDFILPDKASLLAFVQERIRKCSASGLFANPAVTELAVPVIVKSAKEKEDARKSKGDREEMGKDGE